MQPADLPKAMLHSLGLGLPSAGMNVANTKLHAFYDVQLFKHCAVGPESLSISIITP